MFVLKIDVYFAGGGLCCAYRYMDIHILYPWLVNRICSALGKGNNKSPPLCVRFTYFSELSCAHFPTLCPLNTTRLQESNKLVIIGHEVYVFISLRALILMINGFL